MRSLNIAFVMLALLGAGCKSPMGLGSQPVNGTVRYLSGEAAVYAWVQPSAGSGAQADANGHYLLHIPSGVDPVTITATEHPRGTAIAARMTGTVTLRVGRGATQDIVLDTMQPI